MTEPELGDLTHIERPPLPWRSERKTECGLDATRHPTWTREQAQRIAKELGKRRFSMHVCMTCKGTAERHATWDEDPASCLVRYAGPMRRSWNEPEEALRFRNELRAIAILIEAHREEFDALVADLGDMVDLSNRRRKSR